MSLSIKKTLTFIFLILSTSLYSDDWLSRVTSTNWNYNSDFPANNALDIEQDYNGYIWIASYEGLIRFDGVDFKIFKNNRGDYPSDTARVLLKDTDNKIWIGTNSDGLILMDNYKFKSFGIDSGLPDLSVRSLSFDKKNNLWVGTTNGILLVPEKDFSSNKKEVYLKNHIINSINTDSSGTLTAVTNEGKLYRYYNNSFKEYDPESAQNNNHYTTVYSDSAGRNWYGTVSGKIILHDKDNIRIFKISSIFSLKGFLETADHKLWFWSEGGIGYFDESEGIFRVINEKNSLINNSINSLFQDRENNIWIISDVSGIQKYSKGKFTNYSKSFGLDKAVNSLLRYDDKTVMAGTDDGLYIFLKNKLSKNSLTESLKGLRIRNIFKDSSSRLWISTYSSSGLIVIENGKILKKINKENGLSFNKTRTAIEGSDRFIWSGTRSGLNKINPDTFAVEKIYTVSDGLSNDYILSLHESENKDLLIGTDGGGINVLKKDGSISTITSEGGKIAGNIVFRISEDSDGNIWICTNKGVSIWSEDNVYHITENNGLDSNAVFFTVIDNNDTVWFALNNGLQSIKRKLLLKNLYSDKNLSFKRFDTTDGLLAGITPNSWFSKGNKGGIWFPTSSGISVYDPDNSNINTVKSNALVEEIKLDNKTPDIFPKIIEAAVKRIDIDYTGFSYVVPEKTGFRYFLEGFDDDWSEKTFDRKTSYTNLPAGNYNFYLQVSNNDGFWSDQILAYSFKKKDFFYNSPIFYIILTLILFIIMLIAFLTLQKLQEKKRQDLHQVYMDAITSLAGAVEAKDPYTHGHVSRVKDLSSLIGAAMKMGKEKIENLEYMALLHDIGKIGIADTIIRKDGPLDREELNIMQQHPVIGSKIMADTISLKRMALGARYHHENYDGSGYPDGLKGSQIPLEARIISAADAYDAMTSDRPYRKGLSHETAMDELNRGSGTQFDPEIINIINIIMKENNSV